MRLVSTAISLIVDVIIKIFQWFGVNGLLVLALIIEVISCIGYTVGTMKYDQKAQEYSFVSIESVTELKEGDPLLKQNEIDDIYDGEHFYHVRINIFNQYCTGLRYPSLDAQTSEGDTFACTNMPYYERDLEAYKYGVSAEIPPATEAVFDYMLHMREKQLVKSNQVILRDFGERTKDELTVTVPWE